MDYRLKFWLWFLTATAIFFIVKRVMDKRRRKKRVAEMEAGGVRLREAIDERDKRIQENNKRSAELPVTGGVVVEALVPDPVGGLNPFIGDITKYINAGFAVADDGAVVAQGLIDKGGYRGELSQTLKELFKESLKEVGHRTEPRIDVLEEEIATHFGSGNLVVTSGETALSPFHNNISKMLQVVGEVCGHRNMAIHQLGLTVGGVVIVFAAENNLDHVKCWYGGVAIREEKAPRAFLFTEIYGGAINTHVYFAYDLPILTQEVVDKLEQWDIALQQKAVKKVLYRARGAVIFGVVFEKAVLIIEDEKAYWNELNGFSDVKEGGTLYHELQHTLRFRPHLVKEWTIGDERMGYVINQDAPVGARTIYWLTNNGSHQ